MHYSFLIILINVIITRNEPVAVLGGAEHPVLMAKKNIAVDLNKNHLIHVEHN
jgi:hypothetical protein